jgi:CDP-glycerol glycerophosphotransferase (TagB/SpsB family)
MTLKNILKQVLNSIIKIASKLITKDDKYWIFGSWMGQRFSDNSRYLYIYCLENKGSLGLDKIIWATRNKKLFQELKNKNLDVVYIPSLSSFYYHMKCGFAFFDQDINLDLDSKYLLDTKKINLWHGFPLKKIGQYREISKNNNVSWTGNEGFKVLVTSELSSKVLSNAFNISIDNTINGCYPRNHFLLLNENKYNLAKEYECISIMKNEIKNGKKIVLYLPTFRDNKALEFLGSESKGIKDKFIKNISDDFLFITKVHLGEHIFHNNEVENYSGVMNLSPEFDIYSILNLVDILITDYSSIYFDFLYLDRPIIFFPYDLSYYENFDRGLIFNYEKFTPGKKVYSVSDLERELYQPSKFYDVERKSIKDLVFTYDMTDLISSIRDIRE